MSEVDVPSERVPAAENSEERYGQGVAGLGLGLPNITRLGPQVETLLYGVYGVCVGR